MELLLKRGLCLFFDLRSEGISVGLSDYFKGDDAWENICRLS